MTTLETMGISGIRGYAPHSFQKIKFMKPLTLISGQNGSGKTTIIQCLKFMTTGILPPNSDKGKNFIMDTKVAGTPEVTGDLRMVFNVNYRPVLIKRRIILKSTQKGMRFESVEQSMKIRNNFGDESVINHQCAQIQKQVPRMLGITLAMLDNIVFCHQDDSLWPFADNNTLKQIFDQLFQTKSYTKTMDMFWQIKRRQQIKLKEYHVRAEYERQNYHRMISRKALLFDQLEALKVQAKHLHILGKEVHELKQGVTDNVELVKQREKLFYKKGILEASIQNTQTALRKCKVDMIELQYTYSSKKKGFDKAPASNKMQIQDNYNKPFQTKKLPLYITEQKIQSLNIQVLCDVSSQISGLQQKKQLLSFSLLQFNQLQGHLQNLKNYSQLSKRQKQITSQIDRIKDIMPQFRFIKNVKNDQQFVNIIRDKVEDLRRKKLEAEVLRQRYQKMVLPNFYQSGFNQQQVDKLKTEIKQLQRDVSKTSIIILKTVQFQTQQIPSNVDLSDKTLKKGQTFQAQLKNLQVIITAKLKQLKTYQSMPKKYKYKGSQGEQYLTAGLDIQSQIKHYCQSRHQCYVCQRQLNNKQLSIACQKMQLLKNKTIYRIKQLKQIREEHDPFNSVDPQPIINKIQQELNEYQNRRKYLVKKVDQYVILRKHKNTQEHNFILNKSMNNCHLNLDMLTKIIATTEKDHNSDQYYLALPLQKFKESCSSYMFKSQIYKNTKQKLKKIDIIKQQNQIIQKKRLQITNEKNEILIQIQLAEQETQNLDFLKNSYRKLESLMRMQQKGNQKSKTTKSTSAEISQQNIQKNGIKLNTIQQVASQVNRLHFSIIQQKYSIQKLQIEISFSNYYVLKNSQQENHRQISLQLQKFTSTLNTAHALLDTYNLKKNVYDKQMQKLTARVQQIKSELNQKPSSIEYLRLILKIKHLQVAIKGMETLHIQLENAINFYQSKKMAQINTYITQLWKEIYHGNDIEYIEIQCIPDKEGARRKKKNFNYKIMMKKINQKTNEQTKIEMKGRCSMGQKVLASIVIRLGIAQVFCSSTRILALDEPTTNLDKQHMRNLAKALIKLIQMSGGDNLQLIIISHDHDFIKMLEQYAEEYYQIFRDKKRHSKIQKKGLQQLYAQQHRY